MSKLDRRFFEIDQLTQYHFVLLQNPKNSLAFLFLGLTKKQTVICKQKMRYCWASPCHLHSCKLFHSFSFLNICDQSLCTHNRHVWRDRIPLTQSSLWDDAPSKMPIQQDSILYRVYAFQHQLNPFRIESIQDQIPSFRVKPESNLIPPYHKLYTYLFLLP